MVRRLLLISMLRLEIIPSTLTKPILFTLWIRDFSFQEAGPRN